MFRLVVLYRRPESPIAEFEQRYAEHLALVARVPGLRRTEVARFAEAPWGAAAQQLRSFAKGLFTMHYAEVMGVAERGV